MKPCDVKHEGHLNILEEWSTNAGSGILLVTPIGVTVFIGPVRLDIDHITFKAMAEWYLKDQE